MPLPADLTVIQVTDTYVDMAGNPVGGSVSFVPTAQLTDDTGNVVFPQQPVVVGVSKSTGTFTVKLPCTDNSGLAPSSWAYTVEISVQGMDPAPFNVLLPSTLGSSVQLRTVAPAVPPAPPLGTAVYSVNGQSGAVEITAGAVGALPLAGGTVTGPLTLTGGLQIPSGASSGDVLTSDSSGNAAWGPITAAEIPAAAAGAIGGVELNTDLGGTAAAPHVVATHLASALPLAQGGTGSAIQNFAAVFNVMGYGAAGNGSTPDDTAIQNAIAAAVTAGGGIVFLPKGTYKLTSGLTMHSFVTIRGAGALVSTLAPASGVTAITATGSSGAQIIQTAYEDFGITGPGQGTGTAPGMSLTWCTTGTRISRLYIQTCGGDGIIASNCYTVSLRDTFLMFNGGSGLNAQVNINSWAMLGNTSDQNTQWGYYIMGGAASVLHACDAESNGYGGTALLGTFSFTIEGSEHEHNGASVSGQQCGIYLGQGTTPYGPAQNTTLRGNWVQGTSVANYGIVVDGANLTLIEGNGFQNNLTSHINVTANATATIIRSGNYLSTPASGNITDAGTATQMLDYDSTNAVMRSSGLSFGPAGSAADVTLTRPGSGRLAISGSSPTFGAVLKVTNTATGSTVPALYVVGSASTDLVVGSAYTGATFLPWQVQSSGRIQWGSGSAGFDTQLARTGVASLTVTSAIGAGGLTGATAASRYAGATASGAPASGTFAVGDFAVDQSGTAWICTTAGTVGSGCVFKQSGNPMTAAGDIVTGGTAGVSTRVAGNTSATKNFLTGTGTGSAANAPAWGTIAAADLPVATTNTQGAVQMGYAAWTGDPSTAGMSIATAVLSSTSYMASGNLASAMLYLPTAQTLNGFLTFYWVQPTGGSPLNGFIGVYTSSGTKIASIATDLTTLTTGIKRLSLGVTSWSAGYYEVVAMIGTQGTTQGGCSPFTGGTAAIGAVVGQGRIAAPWRSAFIAAGASALPGSIANFSSYTAGLYTMFAALD